MPIANSSTRQWASAKSVIRAILSHPLAAALLLHPTHQTMAVQHGKMELAQAVLFAIFSI